MSDPFFMNQDYLEKSYQEYLKNPTNIPQDLAFFFRGIEFARDLPEGQSFQNTDLNLKVYRLIDHYKQCGHYNALSNPLAGTSFSSVELTLETHGLSSQDLKTVVPTFGVTHEPSLPLEELVHRLKLRYEGSVGFEYMHLIENPKMVEEIDRYLLEEWETPLSTELMYKIAEEILKAEGFEAFLHKRHMGKKRFSLEGAESLIPMLERILENAADHGLKDIVIGMAHRGRLNVLSQILQKDIAKIFYEFESEFVPQFSGSGDVKYHMGYHNERHGVEVTLAANPSHLESVDPVILGMCRAKQDISGSPSALAITIHGDAAIAGQGIVYETMQAMKLNGYQVGGGLHIVINNQIGFTARPDETRSTTYCTDIAKSFQCPVFHVNAHDPIACVKVALFALHLTRKFHIDVFIDLIGFRKYGHNEGDEPGYTQPLMGEKIRNLPKLKELLKIEEALTEQLETKIESDLEELFQQAKSFIDTKLSSHPQKKPSSESPSTQIPLERAQRILRKIATIPVDFQVHPRLKKIIEERGTKDKLDWAMAEAVAFGSLLEEGVTVRLSGEDCCRGTFSHRHAALIDQKEEKVYIPLNNLSINQAPFTVLNSYLSEYAVMGFEYGYTLANPYALVIWEGQFGDFFNGAQIIIDQYLASGETKWDVHSGLVLYLPHGFEGQGPEHSSARIERFLELAADGNYRCVIPTTTGQFYHVLRRQGLEKQKRPLILFTPKSFLRDETSFSDLKIVCEGKFLSFIEQRATSHSVKGCIFTFGKIAYDLLSQKEIENYHLIRIEELYPLDTEGLKKAIANMSGVKRFLFVQDEPKNMGAYPHLRPLLEALIGGQPLHYIGRKEASSPASGSPKISALELEKILKEIFHG